jgi:DNA-binding MarR family transcriptional regulator
MANQDEMELIQRVMGASHVYCSVLSDLLDRTLARASNEQLAMSQVKLLLLIARPAQRFKVTDVASFLGVTNAAASRAIDRLVQRGLVDRSISVEDRRAVDLSLTPEGRTLLDRFSEARNEELLRLLGDQPPKKLAGLAALLDELSVLLLDIDPAQEERCLRHGTHLRRGCMIRDVLGAACTLSAELYGAVPPDEDEDA